MKLKKWFKYTLIASAIVILGIVLATKADEESKPVFYNMIFDSNGKKLAVVEIEKENIQYDKEKNIYFYTIEIEVPEVEEITKRTF